MIDWISGMIDQLNKRHPFMPFGELIEKGKNNFCLELGGIDGIEIQAVKTHVVGGAIGVDFRISSGSLNSIQEIVDTLVCHLGKPFILESKAQIDEEIVYFENGLIFFEEVANVMAECNYLSGYKGDIIFSCAITWLK